VNTGSRDEKQMLNDIRRSANALEDLAEQVARLTDAVEAMSHLAEQVVRSVPMPHR